MNYLKQALMELLSGLTTRKNEKEIWIEDKDGCPITVEAIDDNNYIVRHYWEDGQLWGEEQYRDDQLHGVSKGWDDNGRIWWEELWENGTCIEVIE